MSYHNHNFRQLCPVWLDCLRLLLWISIYAKHAYIHQYWFEWICAATWEGKPPHFIVETWQFIKNSYRNHLQRFWYNDIGWSLMANILYWVRLSVSIYIYAYIVFLQYRAMSFVENTNRYRFVRFVIVGTFFLWNVSFPFGDCQHKKIRNNSVWPPVEMCYITVCFFFFWYIDRILKPGPMCGLLCISGLEYRMYVFLLSVCIARLHFYLFLLHDLFRLCSCFCCWMGKAIPLGIIASNLSEVMLICIYRLKCKYILWD